MDKNSETTERRMHREKCKHHSDYEDICYLLSHNGPNGGITIGCTPSTRCPRMARYDNKIKKHNGRE